MSRRTHPHAATECGGVARVCETLQPFRRRVREVDAAGIKDDWYGNIIRGTEVYRDAPYARLLAIEQGAVVSGGRNSPLAVRRLAYECTPQLLEVLLQSTLFFTGGARAGFHSIYV